MRRVSSRFRTSIPGTYELTVTLDQFKTSVIKDIRAEVASAVTRDVMLEVGAVDENVTVTPTQETALQKEDAAVGLDLRQPAVHAAAKLPPRRLPAHRHCRPRPRRSGEIAGARRDQSTFMVDGVDVSEKAFGAPFQLVIPTPVDAVEEFRVAVVQRERQLWPISRRPVHLHYPTRHQRVPTARLYEYHQNDGLNANSWTSNRLRLPKATLSDNRFGGSLGGPIVRNRTFFFGLYEGRRLSTAATVTRLVPTDTLKQGLLRFVDTSGAVQTIDPRTFDPARPGRESSRCSRCLRLYPEAERYVGGRWAEHLGVHPELSTRNRRRPRASSASITFSTPTGGSTGRSRCSTAIATRRTSSIWSISSSPRSGRCGRARFPLACRTCSAARMTNELRFGWVRDSDDAVRVTPEPAVAGLNVAVDLAGTLTRRADRPRPGRQRPAASDRRLPGHRQLLLDVPGAHRSRPASTSGTSRPTRSAPTR